VLIDARERMRDAGMELDAGSHAQDVEAKIGHVAAASRLLLEALAQVATAAGIAPLVVEEPEGEDDSE
jgi:hypothetical protein